jgi:dihydroxyacetone kinase-like protein
MDTESLRRAIEKINIDLEEIGDELNRIDAQLGDGDLGVTLLNGFRNMGSVANSLPEDVGSAFMLCAKAMTKVSGSSFGTLTAIALMAVAKDLQGETDVDWSDMSRLVMVAIDAMRLRGKANLGDKTVLDSLNAIQLKISNLDHPDIILEQAKIAAINAISDFKQKQCMIGRARIFGDKTIGMDDPGMIAISRLLSTL